MSDNGDGDSDFLTVGEYTRQVESCQKTVFSNLERINMALWGVNGRGGIVGDIRDIKMKGKMWDRIMTVITSIIVAVITACILRWI